MFYRCLRITICFLLLVTIVRVLMIPNSEPLTLTGLLQFLQESKSVQIPFLRMESVTTGKVSGCAASWVNFINSIKSIVNILIFLVNGLIQLAQYVVTFMHYIFIF